MSAASPPDRRLRVGLLLAGLSLLLFLAVVVLDLRRTTERSIGPDGYSRSGLGHTGLLALLQERGVPVVHSRWRSDAHAGPDTLLVIAEPRADLTGGRGRTTWSRLFAAPRHVLLVLPKRRALFASRHSDRWVGATGFVPLAAVREVLTPFDLEVLARPEDPPPEDGIPFPLPPPAPSGPEAEPEPLRAWRSARGWPAPDLSDLQLLEPGRGLVALLECEEGVLVGRLNLAGGPTVTIVSDPDLLANHGLLRGRNAEIALSLLEDARERRRPVVWDETWHGFVREPSVSSLLLERPLGLLVGALALLGAVAVWAGSVRFGGARALPPLLEGGKAFLVRNTADLLRVGGHSSDALRRYARATYREVERRLHLEGRPPAEVRSGVAQAAAARTLPGPDDIETLVEQAAGRGHDARGLVLAAARIHRWREELTHGRRIDP